MKRNLAVAIVIVAVKFDFLHDVNLNVNCTLQPTMKAPRVSRGIALLFLTLEN
jgi:hypothetical protein